MKKLLFPLGLLLTACGPTQQVIQPPGLQVQDITLARLSLPVLGQPATAYVNLELAVSNPNPIAVRLAQIEAQLVVEGQYVGRVTVPDVNLPAQGQTVQRAQLQLPLTVNTMTTFLQIARGQEVSYRLDGSFKADLGPLGQPRFGPFTFSQGIWKQPAIQLF
ncbi:MAG: LEA type 2 family protein [Deinococcus sp.]|uniref:LEA type 2 family protein n=1 Tax=Deinococcus sp. TaxID=47478 RepID=UPI0026DD4BE3|nr:LEA type 2 family protein [Deinococcus sp.]MDO4245874.1 LEA type 2 family protein [Deinococcus sp.]